ncbi:MAG TPA: lysylphosphatidylglycerol synthase transmembrane domain-containing protein [Candidatus Saccharimonadales bacterium]|nr:lysylphosphatidylglycerol synthase transmembrane domain-containing protein [Candidatus Saccharimonadales bacterium]
MTFRRILQWVGLLALASLIFLSRAKIGQVPHLLRGANWYILLLLIPMQVLSYWFNAKYYQSFFAIFGYYLATRPLLERAMALNFVNQAFPSGGIVGASYLSNSLSDQVPPGKTTLSQLLSYGFTVGSFLVVLALGFLLLFLTGQLDQGSVRFMMLLVLGILIFSLVIIVIIADRKKVERVGRAIVGFINRTARAVFRHRGSVISEAQSEHFFDEFYHGYEVLGEQRGHWRLPFLYSLGANVAEVATVYVVFLAFGQALNPGVMVTAYTLANIVSLISPITGGAGVYEATMIGSLVALGVPFDVSFAGVLVYRVLNAIIFLPVGYYYYRKTL